MASVAAAVAPHPRILLVEDDPALRATLAEVLEERGYEVACAGNGRQALDALIRAPAPSAILLDLAMPVMDGWAFRSAQQRDPRLADIPTIVLSASLGVDGRRFDGPAPVATLAKPFDLNRLLDALRRVCEPLGAASQGARAASTIH
jgi:CheY-like chemotaxis protein